MSADIRFSVLGPLTAWRCDVPVDIGQPEQRALLAALLLRNGESIGTAELIHDIWGEDAPSSARSVLRTYVHRLRRSLHGNGTALIASSSGGYVTTARRAALDLHGFNRLVSRARSLRLSGDVARAWRTYAEAETMWKGSALVGVPGPYAASQAVALDELRTAVTEERLSCAIEMEHYGEVVAELSALTRRWPLREKLSEMLMVALHASGRQSEALTVFHNLSHLLRKEFGVEPSQGLQTIHERLLVDDEPVSPRPVGVPAQPATLRERPAVPRQLPPPPVGFAGRRNEADSLENSVTRAAADRPLFFSVSGLPGIGKTGFAIQVAHEMADQYGDGQLFADLGGPDPTETRRPPSAVLGEFLTALGVPAQSMPPEEGARTVLFRNLVADRRILVLLDNARDSAQVRPLLTGNPGVLPLITSRHRLTGLVATHNCVPIFLEALGSRESRLLLTGRIGRGPLGADPEAAAAIIRGCQGLPMALSAIAAAFRQRGTPPLSTLARELRDPTDCMDMLSETGDRHMDIRAALEETLSAVDTDAARPFRLLGLHPGPHVTAPASAALLGLPLRRVRGPLAVLTRTHLLTEHAPSRYRMHPVVLAYAREQAEVQDDPDSRAAALRRLFLHYADA